MTGKIIDDMAKVSIKSEKNPLFWWNLSCERVFCRYVVPVIDKVQGLRHPHSKNRYFKIRLLALHDAGIMSFL